LMLTGYVPGTVGPTIATGAWYQVAEIVMPKNGCTKLSMYTE